jgi:Rrf2 family protein
MILSKTTEYSLTILGFMATRDEEMYSAEFLYNELKIPRRYLRRLLTDLSSLGFLRSIKGRNGGFVFAKDLKEINFDAVITAMEGKEIINQCLLGFTCCLVEKPCVMHDDWIEASTKLKEILINTNLADLRTKYKQSLASGMLEIPDN